MQGRTTAADAISRDLPFSFSNTEEIDLLDGMSPVSRCTSLNSEAIKVISHLDMLASTDRKICRCMNVCTRVSSREKLECSIDDSLLYTTNYCRSCQLTSTSKNPVSNIIVMSVVHLKRPKKTLWHILKVYLNINILFSAFLCIQQIINNWKLSDSHNARLYMLFHQI